MTHIKITDLARKLPYIIKNAPFLIKGVRVGKDTSDSKPMGLGVLFEQAAQKNPHGVAIYFKDQSITYDELDKKSNKIANFFLDQGLDKGDVVCLLMENRIELLILVIAFSKIGVITALINSSHRGALLKHSISLVAPKKIIVGEELVNALEEIKQEADIATQNIFYVAENSRRGHQKYLNIFECADEYSHIKSSNAKSTFYHDPAFYIYTSGTTGMPKAAVFTHGRINRVVGGFGYACMQLTPEDVMYIPLPFFHSTAMVICWGSALTGAASIVMRKKFSASEFWEDCRKYNATCFGYVGELCRYLYKQAPVDSDRDNSVYKIIGNGLRAEIWEPFKKRFGIERVHEFYGASEGNIAFINVFNFSNSVGYTFVKHKFVEYDSNGCAVRNKNGRLKEVQKGQPGLLISSIDKKSPFDGYSDKSKNESTIIENGFKQGDKWFNTGDVMRSLGFRHAQFVDRLGDTFRWKGENVATTQVENEILKCDGIQECICYAVKIPNVDGKAGMIAINAEQSFNIDTFYKKLTTKLPSYSIPVFIRVCAEPIATTDSFKYIKGDLKKQAYALDAANSSVYVLLPGSTSYTSLNNKIVAGINNDQYSF